MTIPSVRSNTSSIKFQADTLRSLAFGSISGTYNGVGTALDFPTRQFFLQNFTDVDLMFSFNGVDDHFPLPADGFFLNDLMSNRASSGQGWFLAEGSRLYVRDFGAAPSLGAVYFSTFFGAE